MAEFTRNSHYRVQGPDSEELLMDLYEKFADRELVLFHRSIVAGEMEKVQEYLTQHPTWVEATLLPHESFEEVKKCNGMDYDSFSRFPTVMQQTTPYPNVPQFTTGDSDVPNELFPDGEYDQPETDLDTAFWTPLMRACLTGHTELIQLFVAAGANKNILSPSRANVVTCLLETTCGDTYEEFARNLSLVATSENMNYEDYLTKALTDEDLTDIAVIGALLDNGHKIDPECEAIQGDMESWIPKKIVKLINQHLKK